MDRESVTVAYIQVVYNRRMWRKLTNLHHISASYGRNLMPAAGNIGNSSPVDGVDFGSFSE